MPTYQQRFGHAPAPKKRKHKTAPTTAVGSRSRSLAQREGGIVHLRQQPREGGIGTQPRKAHTPSALERAFMAKAGYQREQALTRSKVAGARPNAVGTFLGGIGHHPLTSLRDVTGIDVHRFYHPIRAIEQDRAAAAERGSQYAAGKVSGSAAIGSIGMFPGGGPMKGLGRLLGRGGADVAEAVPKLSADAQQVLTHHERYLTGLRSDLKRSTAPQEQAKIRRNIAKAEESLKTYQAGEAPSQKPKPEIFTAGETTGPLTKEQSALAARQAMREAVLPAGKRAAATQKKLIRTEKSERVAKAMQAEEAAGGGLAGVAAAKGHLGGEYSKVAFDKLQKGIANKADVEGLAQTIDKHTFFSDPERNFWARTNAKVALQNMHEHGSAPRTFETQLLGQVFSPEVVQGSRTLGTKLLDVGNIPRALQTTLDVSFLGRQAILVAASKPGIFAKGFAPTFKSLVKEGKYHEASAAVRADPLYDDAVKDGVQFSDIGDIRHREEAFSSDYAEKITGGKHSPVRASGRAYSAAGNFYRMAMYRHFRELAESGNKGILGRTPGFRGGGDLELPKTRRQIAEVVNTLTGRGSGGEKWEAAAPFLNNLLFSPRFLRARINMLNPVWYARLDPFARRQAFRALVRMAGSMALVLEAAHHFTGARVGLDPRSSDFAKIRFGKTRIDIGGGFQPYIRLVAQMSTGQTVSSTTGKVRQLGPGFGDNSRRDVLIRFLEGKLAPTPSTVDDFFRGTNLIGQPTTVKMEAYNRLVPLVVQDAVDLQKSKGSIPLGVAGYGLTAFGIGLQTYSDPTKAQAKTKLHEATKQQNVHLTNLVKKGALPRGQVKEYREALDIYDKRNQINTTIDAATKDKPVARETQKIQALLSLLAEHKLLKPAEVKRYQHHYATTKLSAKELQRDRDWFWRTSGIAPMITWYRGVAGAND